MAHADERPNGPGIFPRYNFGRIKASPKSGRPPKGADRLKADYLDIRLFAAEKQAFRDAADLAGLDLSA